MNGDGEFDTVFKWLLQVHTVQWAVQSRLAVTLDSTVMWMPCRHLVATVWLATTATAIPPLTDQPVLEVSELPIICLVVVLWSYLLYFWKWRSLLSYFWKRHLSGIWFLGQWIFRAGWGWDEGIVNGGLVQAVNYIPAKVRLQFFLLNFFLML